jgi:hypothetical protein
MTLFGHKLSNDRWPGTVNSERWTMNSDQGPVPGTGTNDRWPGTVNSARWTLNSDQGPVPGTNDRWPGPLNSCWGTVAGECGPMNNEHWPLNNSIQRSVVHSDPTVSPLVSLYDCGLRTLILFITITCPLMCIWLITFVRPLVDDSAFYCSTFYNIE